MTMYLIELGREQLLALAELWAVFGDEIELVDYEQPMAVVRIKTTDSAQKLIGQLGGTIKIAEAQLLPAPDQQALQLTQILTDKLLAVESREFGVSVFGQGWSMQRRREVGMNLKRSLKAAGRPGRFVESKDLRLSSVIVTKELGKPMAEVWVGTTKTGTYVAQTLAVQGWEAWSQRDYGRPARDSRRGMLPPKLAQMMVNLAQVPRSAWILDPFCGVGTILAEAYLLGYENLIGSDADQRAIVAAQTNLTWLMSQNSDANKLPLHLYAEPVERIRHQLSNPIQAIVTETDLGPPTLPQLAPHERRRLFLGLADRYQQWLEELYQTLAPGGTMVLALPILLDPVTALPIEDLVRSHRWQLDDLLPSLWLTMTGNTTINPKILRYGRVDQVIGRQLVRLRKVNS